MKRATVLFTAGTVLVAVASFPFIRAAAQQEVVTDENLNEMIARAKTPADHEAIAVYYDREATDNENKAHLHRDAANLYAKPGLRAPFLLGSFLEGLCESLQ